MIPQTDITDNIIDTECAGSATTEASYDVSCAPATKAPAKSAPATNALFVAIAAGGTAGHINPALALAEELRSQGHRVVFIGQTTKLEGELVPASGFDFIPISVSGFNRTRPWTLISSVLHIMHAARVIQSAFAHDTPDVCVGFGAYVELPLLLWSKQHHVPFVLHEQNSVVGLANTIAARYARGICVAFPQAKDILAKHAPNDALIEITGNPVRRCILDANREAARAELGATSESCVLLVSGGSLGASHINEQLVARKDALLAHKNLIIMHSCGKADYEHTKARLALSNEEATRWKLMPYIADMGRALAAADVVVSRAGASSIAEIAAAGRASILIPYPHATADHQRVNAHLLVDAHAAYLLDDAALNSKQFDEQLSALIEQPQTRMAFSQAARSLAGDKAQARLADVVRRACLARA